MSTKKENLLVQKYGGSSLASTTRIKVVAEHILNSLNRAQNIIVVVSAMGDQTDDLLKNAQEISKTPPRREVDMLVSAGERISMALLSIALHELNVSAVSFTGSQSGIITDDTFGNARIKDIRPFRVEEALKRNQVVIIAGFQGVSENTKEITTLGRGGSDLTALALSATFKAKECEIYKDVDGVCTANPRLVKETKVIEHMSWKTLSELTWSGSEVLHPRAVDLATKRAIPIRIRSSFNFNHPGTLISESPSMEKLKVDAISALDKQINVQITSDKSILSDIYIECWKNGFVTQMLSSDQAQDKFHRTNLIISFEMLENLKKLATKNQWNLKTEETFFSLITIIGQGFFQNPELIQTIEKVSAEHSPIIHFDVKNSTFKIGVLPEQKKEVLNALHSALLSFFF